MGVRDASDAATADAATADAARRRTSTACPPHHDLWHAGRLRIEGTTESPIFLMDDGKPLDARTGFAGAAEPESDTPA